MLSRDEVFSIIFLDVPSAPVDLIRTKSTYSSITIRWNAPKDTGNYHIITYFVERESTADNNRIGTNYTDMDAFGGSPAYGHTFHNLQSNTTYMVYVSAYNLAGKGAVARQTYETVPYTRPGR